MLLPLTASNLDGPKTAQTQAGNDCEGTSRRIPAAVQLQLGLNLPAWQIPFLQVEMDRPFESSAEQGTKVEIEAHIAGHSCLICLTFRWYLNIVFRLLDRRGAFSPLTLLRHLYTSGIKRTTASNQIKSWRPNSLLATYATWTPLIYTNLKDFDSKCGEQGPMWKLCWAGWCGSKRGWSGGGNLSTSKLYQTWVPQKLKAYVRHSGMASEPGQPKQRPRLCLTLVVSTTATHKLCILNKTRVDAVSRQISIRDRFKWWRLLQLNLSTLKVYQMTRSTQPDTTRLLVGAPSQQRPWDSLEMSWESWCLQDFASVRCTTFEACERRSGMAPELWVSLLMCPRRIAPRQFWMTSALRNTCSQNPKWTSILCWTLARFSSIQ